MSLSWPSAHDDESKIIEQFKFIREHLTKESGEKFCAASPGCGFLMELYDAGHLHYEGAFQSYLSCLRTLVPLVARSDFLCTFVKNCSGCAASQFLSIVYLHPILENEVKKKIDFTDINMLLFSRNNHTIIRRKKRVACI